MKFCFVFDGLGCGGIERVGVDYCNALIDCGHEVTVINLSPSLNDYLSQLSDKAIYKVREYSRMLAPERYCSLITRRSWGRFVYPLAYVVCSLILAAKKPFFLRGLGKYDVAIAFSGHYNDLTFVAFGCVRAAKRFAWLHGTLNSYALISDGYVNLYKHFTKLICLSDEGVEEFKDARHWLTLPLEKLYNPIDLNRTVDDLSKVAELHEVYGDFILMVARLAMPKDPETLIDAVAILKERHGIEKHCLIVGDGPDMDRVRRHVMRSPVSNLIHLIGYESNPYPYYKACGVFVLSSSNEGLPTVLLEAMAFAKPVVSTNVPGAREILECGEDGLLCRVGDSEDMAKKIAMLFEDKTLWCHYAERSAERAKAFSKKRAINGLLGFVCASSDSELASDEVFQ